MPEDNHRNSSIANTNNDGLRNRRPTPAAMSDKSKDASSQGATVAAAAAAAAATSPCPNRTHKVDHPENTNIDSNARIRFRTSLQVLKWIVHAAAIACFVAGIILRTSHLHTGEECDMTYSMRIFLRVETTGSKSNSDESAKTASSKYGLYKFVDQRDLRYTQLRRRQQQQQLGRNEHCVNSSNNIVVYVPGHWGTYDQARSLGAHGLGLTRARESSKLVRETQHRILSSASNDTNNDNSTENFVYDVYALDFAEQGGALHGNFLRYQSVYLASVLRQLSEDCGLWDEYSGGGESSEGSSGSVRSSGSGSSGAPRKKNKSLILVAHSMGGYVARKVLLDHPELRVENLITLATPHSNPLYSFDKSIYDFHRELLEGGGGGGDNTRTSNERAAANVGFEETDDANSKVNKQQPLLVSISGGLRDEMIEPSACAVSSGKGSFESGFSSLFSKPRGLSETKSKADTTDSWTILATKLVAKAHSSNSKSHSSRQDEISFAPLLGMDHRAIVWCHQLLEEVRKVLWVLATSSENTTQERLDKVRNVVGDGDGNKHETDNFGYYSNKSNVQKNGLVVRFGPVRAVCMESSMIYNLPYLLALYALLVGLRCARVTRADRASSMLPVWATILFGWTFRSDLGWLATVILALVANSFNLALVHLLPVGFLLRRRRRCLEKEPKAPIRTLWGALAVVIVVVFGVVIACCCCLPGLETNSFTVRDWFGLWNSALYVCAIASIYAMLIVWMVFIDNDPNRPAIDKSSSSSSSDVAGDESFEIQLIGFVMMVVPFLVAGPLVLMAWEQQTQPSSWWTLLSLQLPVGILSLTKLSQTKIAEIRGKDDEDTRAAATTATTIGRVIFPLVLPPKNHLGIRSISIYLSLFVLCSREPGLFSRGVGYLVPNVAIMLVWVGIAQSLLFGCP